MAINTNFDVSKLQEFINRNMILAQVNMNPIPIEEEIPSPDVGDLRRKIQGLEREVSELRMLVIQLIDKIG